MSTKATAFVVACIAQTVVVFSATSLHKNVAHHVDRQVTDTAHTARPSVGGAPPEGVSPPQLCNGMATKASSDWLGTDILPDDQPLYTVNATDCCAACANHTTSGTAPCLYWSRYTSKFHGRCYLKTHATNRHNNHDMESGSMPGAPDPGGGPPPPGPPAPPPPPAPPMSFTVDLGAPTRPFHKPFLECVGSSHMAMGLLAGNNASGPNTAAGKGLQDRVGALWREHIKLVHDELNMSALIESVSTHWTKLRPC